MALTKQHWFLEVQLIDRGSRVTTRRYHLVATDTAWDASAVNTAVTSILSALNGVTALVVKSYRMGVLFLETSLTLPSSAEAELEQHLLITGQIKGLPNKSAVIDVPGPEQLCFLAASGEGADQMNRAQSEVDTFIDMFDSAGTNLIKVSDGEFIDANIVRGRKTHSKSTFG